MVLVGLLKIFAQISSKVLTLQSKLSYLQNKCSHFSIKSSTSYSNRISHSIRNQLIKGCRYLNIYVSFYSSDEEIAELLVNSIMNNGNNNWNSNSNIDNNLSKVIIERLSPLLNYNTRSYDFETALNVIKKAQNELEQSNKISKKYNDARKVLSTIKTIVLSEDHNKCIDMLQHIFNNA